MPRRKEEFKKLTEKLILKRNPQRKDLSGDKRIFKKLVGESTKHEPFDKKRA